MKESRRVTSRFAFAVVVAATVAVSAACDRDEGSSLTLARADTDADFVPVDYELTSETYKKWLVAQENLQRSAGDADLGLPAERILLTNPSAGSIDTVVAELERVPQTREAIESAGLDVRDYVLATLALYQATDRPDTLDLGPGGVPLPVTNVELASRHAEEIATVRAASPVAFVDDRPRARGKGKGKAKGGKGKARGRGRGKN